jgi:hypothetical protein
LKVDDDSPCTVMNPISLVCSDESPWSRLSNVLEAVRVYVGLFRRRLAIEGCR